MMNPPVLPPFVPVPLAQNVPPGSSMTIPPAEEGPFCFGIDKLICSKLPPVVYLGGAPGSVMEQMMGRVGINVQQTCTALTNVICFMLVFIALLAILGIAFAGLIF
jgi:hypothetical protein